MTEAAQVADLKEIAKQATVVVLSTPFDEGDTSPTARAIDKLSDLLDAYAQEWGKG